MRSNQLAAWTGLLVLGAWTGQARAQEYFRQSPIDAAGGYSSQDARNTNGIGWFSEVADNFPGQAGWNINHVAFWGGYVASPHEPGHTHGFTIRFYDDAGGRPGTRVYEQDQFSFTETQFYLSPPLPPAFPDGIAGYRYEVDLPTPFVVGAAGQYWFSVVAILDRGGTSVEPQWGWVAAAQGSAPSAMQWFFSPGNFTSTGGEQSFALSHAQSSSCVADLDDGTGTGHADGAVTIDDLLYYLGLYEAGSSEADLDDGSGSGAHDGAVTIDDLLFFLAHYEAGC